MGLEENSTTRHNIKKHEQNPKPDNAVEKSKEIKIRLCKIS